MFYYFFFLTPFDITSNFSIPFSPFVQQYQVTIRDPHQPLLMSKPKKRDLRRGQGNIYLIPELCVATGLSDDMRNDYSVMRDFAVWTRMAPDKRVLALRKFNTQLFENEQVRRRRRVVCRRVGCASFIH